MATLESALPFTMLAANPCSNNYYFSAKPPHTINLNVQVSSSRPSLSHSHSHTLVFSHTLSSNSTFNRRHGFELLCTALQVVATEAKPDQTQTTNIKKKLYVFNLPWSLSSADIKGLFGQCGTVTDVEIIKYKDGRMSGFGFVTMASGEEAQAAIDKFDSHACQAIIWLFLKPYTSLTCSRGCYIMQEISRRIIRVELARRFKKPRPPGPPAGETHHKIYASNLAWKVRSSHLREFFTKNFKKPVSARVVFDSPSGRCAGYGFVSFVTKEEAEDAISALDGKELMGRQLHLKFSQKTIEEAGSDKDEEQGYDGQLKES